MDSIYKNSRHIPPCLANVSYSTNGTIAASYQHEYRDIKFFSPSGVCYKPCEQDTILIIPLEGAATCAGVLQKNDASIAPGELILSSAGGAKIHLKNDGTISLNGLKISNNGVII